MASAVFAKLNLKDQKDILVLNAPESFTAELGKLKDIKVHTRIPAHPIAFALAFVTRQTEIDSLATSVTARAEGDAVVWFAYPKGSSRRYKSDINRENRWSALGRAGFEGVRMVAIDEDWSALRFRRVEFINNMTRHVSGAMTKAGRARVTKNS